MVLKQEGQLLFRLVDSLGLLDSESRYILCAVETDGIVGGGGVLLGRHRLCNEVPKQRRLVSLGLLAPSWSDLERNSTQF